MADIERSPRRLPEGVETVLLAAVAGIPCIGGPISVALGRTLERSRYNIHEMVHEAVVSSGASELLIARVQEDERLSYLLLNALEAGERTSMAEKRRVLGQAVGRAARNPGLISENELQVRALQDLDVPHVEAMSVIAEAPGRHPELRADLAISKELAAYPEPVIAALVRNGIVEAEPSYADPNAIGGLSRFGRQLLADLRSQSDS